MSRGGNNTGEQSRKYKGHRGRRGVIISLKHLMIKHEKSS